MANEPLRRRQASRDSREEPTQPKIWAEGGQRPPFDLRAMGRSTLHLTRLGIAPLHAWGAKGVRQMAVNVKDGVGRIPADKLGRAERFFPSHLRVAGWIKNFAAILSHASAAVDPDVKRGNALVAEIEPHLWPVGETKPQAMPAHAPEPPAAEAAAEVAEPVVLPEPAPPEPMQVDDDPLASIRDEIGGPPAPGRRGRVARPALPAGPAVPPDQPGPLATTAIQVSGYLIGWATTIIALPYGLARSLWLYAKGVDLRKIVSED